MADVNIPNNGNILNNGNAPNNGSAPNNGNVPNEIQLSPDLQKVLDSLTPRQRMRYEASQSKIDILETILDERNKSEVLWELITVIIYAAITISLTVMNARYFNTDDSTKAFSIIISCIYYMTKIVVMGIKVEINGFIYNKIYAFIIIAPIMVGLLVAVTLDIYVQSPLITTKFINVGISKILFEENAPSALQIMPAEVSTPSMPRTSKISEISPSSLKVTIKKGSMNAKKLLICYYQFKKLKRKRKVDENFDSEYGYIYGIVTTGDVIKDPTDLRKNVKRILMVIVCLLKDRVKASEEPTVSKRQSRKN
ncbi:hypothetical protein C1646_800989 [Rhizophagus diaphanus]|nr:hypothetical protein C1646_800989 [Rhizophagus diaphanus] [Rhizophagus sp. MUCL 43196]